MFPHVQPEVEWEYVATGNAFSQFNIFAGDALVIRHQFSYQAGELVVIERGGAFYLRRYDAFCRRLRILGKVDLVNGRAADM